MTTQKLTISQIAKMAGVSKASVSRVLNNYPHISNEIREKVMTVVSETGYERNHVARMLASARSNMIGLVIPSSGDSVFTDPYFPTLTRGISIGATQNNLTLALFLCRSAKEGEDTVRSILSNGLLDGMIITADHHGATFQDDLTSGEMPFVYIGRPYDDAPVHYIDTDNFAGGVMATEYLIKQGYRRIGLIGSAMNSSGDDRFAGYKHALEANNIPFDKSLITFGDYSMDSGKQGILDLLPAKPEAVFAVSDTMAVGAMHSLREHGIRIPDDIAVVGYDDLPPAVQADPALTTIRQPIEEVGRLSVETLLQMVTNPNRPLRQVQLPVEIIVRGSA